VQKVIIWCHRCSKIGAFDTWLMSRGLGSGPFDTDRRNSSIPSLKWQKTTVRSYLNLLV
jgi:hypothetical protein